MDRTELGEKDLYNLDSVTFRWPFPEGKWYAVRISGTMHSSPIPGFLPLFTVMIHISTQENDKFADTALTFLYHIEAHKLFELPEFGHVDCSKLTEFLGISRSNLTIVNFATALREIKTLISEGLGRLSE